MNAIHINGTDDIPTIHLDSQQNQFEIAGKSMPEDVAAFYAPILAWLDEYAQNTLPKTVFNFKLIYFNTASSKLILDIMMKLEEICQEGKDILIRWHYPEDDEDMQEAGEEYADMIEVPFEKIPY